MGIEDDLMMIRSKLLEIENKIDKLIPVIRDVSKHLAEAKELTNKGKKPRKQPKKHIIEINTR